jgi:acyl carrier protein
MHAGFRAAKHLSQSQVLGVVNRGFATGPPAGSYLSKAEVTARVLDVVKTIRSVPPTVTSDASFSGLGFDTLIRKELWAKFEDEFCVEVPQKDADAQFVSVEGVVNYFAGHPKAR